MNSVLVSKDDLLHISQENTGLRNELNKEVKNNYENEAKIKSLLAQQNRYENNIKYLYNIIENFQCQSDNNNETITDLKTQLSKTLSQLKHCEKICDDKEKFIQYRESQLIEFENEIYSLKERIKSLTSQKKMDYTHTDIPIDLTDKSTDELVGIITE